MNRKICMLATALAFGSATLAGCDRNEPKSTAPKASAPKPVANATPAVPKVSLGTPTEKERKDSSPVQGATDPREPVQSGNYEPKK
jgi:hypothetical protein